MSNTICQNAHLNGTLRFARIGWNGKLLSRLEYHWLTGWLLAQVSQWPMVSRKTASH